MSFALAQPRAVAVGPFARFALAGALVLAAAGTLADFTSRDTLVLAGSTSSPERAAAEATNAARAGHCAPLKPSSRLAKAAQRHADDMARKGYFSHASKDGRSWDQRIRGAGYGKPAGENIAYGYDSGAGVVGGWMDSPGHRRNILDCDFRKVGYGYSAEGGYWVQDFGY